jgi:hypothetical protein
MKEVGHTKFSTSFFSLSEPIAATLVAENVDNQFFIHTQRLELPLYLVFPQKRKK